MSPVSNIFSTRVHDSIQDFIQACRSNHKTILLLWYQNGVCIWFDLYLLRFFFSFFWLAIPSKSDVAFIVHTWTTSTTVKPTFFQSRMSDWHGMMVSFPEWISPLLFSHFIYGGTLLHHNLATSNFPLPSSSSIVWPECPHCGNFKKFIKYVH